MNIGVVAAASGLPAKTVRYYEEIGLVRADRRENGYRDFADRDLNMLVFISRARSLGFSISDCRSLLSLWDDRGRASADVKRLTRDHLDRIARKIEELDALRCAAHWKTWSRVARAIPAPIARSSMISPDAASRHEGRKRSCPACASCPLSKGGPYAGELSPASRLTGLPTAHPRNPGLPWLPVGRRGA